MSVKSIQGLEEVLTKLGANALDAFTDLRLLQLDTYYDEDRESFEKQVHLTIMGSLGTIDVELDQITNFKLASISTICGLQISQQTQTDALPSVRLFDSQGNLDISSRTVRFTICTNPYI